LEVLYFLQLYAAPSIVFELNRDQPGIMEDLRNMDYPALLNLLAQQTMLYTQMLSGNVRTGEFYDRKQLIERITAEIGLRQENNHSHEVSHTEVSAVRMDE
jgi:hypothetical protein